MNKDIVKGLKKFSIVWKEAKDKDLNEADVVTRIVKFLEEVLNYDVFKNITKEFQIKERFVDLAVKIDEKVKFYIEVKSANTMLKESHIFQAESYASQSGVNWVVLTNGADWQLYHLTFDKTGIEHHLVFDIDLINGDFAEISDKIYYLSFASLKKKDIDKFWDKYLSLHATSIIKAIFHEDTLYNIRKEIRRRSNILVDEDDILFSIKKLFKNDILSQYGDIIKISRKRVVPKKNIDVESSDDNVESIVSLNINNTQENTEQEKI